MLINHFILLAVFMVIVHQPMDGQTRNFYVEGSGNQVGVIHATGFGDAGFDFLRSSEFSGTDWRLINDGGNFKFLDALDNFNGTGTLNFQISPSGITTIFNGLDAEATNDLGTLILGSTSGLNLGMDNNEILARNNGAPADLFLQHNSPGDVGIGSTAAETTQKLTVMDDGFQIKLTNTLQTGNDWFIGASNPNWTIGGERLTIDDDSNTNDPILLLDADTDAVGISTNVIPAGYKLAVDGRTICEEVTVDLSGGWPDYVFSPEYDLMSLKDVAHFIEEHGHLPSVPKASQIEEKGLSLGEMQRIAFEKIEELTLHVIRLEKENQRLATQLSEYINHKKGRHEKY